MAELNTKIGLEIHVQLKTKSKMFCSCDNEAFQKKPNTTVCPVCLGMPGVLPVANEEAIKMTIKTGLASNCTINKTAKFDRKHYFYPDLPKGFQISQYDEPFCSGGFLEIDGAKIQLNRIHLEEDAGKLIHSNGNSLVDLNRAGTPLMEIVTEPDITSPEQAGEFMRQLQKIVRDIVQVSEASMEKGHMRCDANISVNDGQKMSEIVELKNINSFRFIEKALTIEEARLKEEYPNWPSGKKKVTRGYDSKKNTTYPQRVKEEASDYRYFPEPDLPPIEASQFDLEDLRAERGKSAEDRSGELVGLGIAESDAKILAHDFNKDHFFQNILSCVDQKYAPTAAKTIVHNYFTFPYAESDESLVPQFGRAVEALAEGRINKSQFSALTKSIYEEKSSFEEALSALGVGAGDGEAIAEEAIDAILGTHEDEVLAYKSGKTQLLGFFMGEVMKRTQGKADPQVVRKTLIEKLGK